MCRSRRDRTRGRSRFVRARVRVVVRSTGRVPAVCVEHALDRSRRRDRAGRGGAPAASRTVADGARRLEAGRDRDRPRARESAIDRDRYARPVVRRVGIASQVEAPIRRAVGGRDRYRQRGHVGGGGRDSRRRADRGGAGPGSTHIRLRRWPVPRGTHEGDRRGPRFAAR